MTRFCPTFRNPTLCLALAAAIAGLPQSAAAQEKTYAVAPVAVTGEPAPGTGGQSFARVGHVDLNDSGIVAVQSILGHFSSEDEGIWVGSPGNMSLVVRAGDPIPGDATHTFFQFRGAMANASADVVFDAVCRVDGLVSTCSGLWTGSAGNLRPLAVNGDLAPGTGGLTFYQYSFYTFSFDGLGVTSFNASINLPEGNRYGAWRGTPGVLEPIAVPGDPAPGTAGLSFTDIFGLVTNEAGTKVIAAITDDPAFDWPGGYWKTGTTGLSLIANVGDEAPGTGGRIFGNLTAGASTTTTPFDTGIPSVASVTGPVLNRSDDVVFNGFLDPLNPDIDPSDPAFIPGEEGIWIQDGTGLRLVAIIGDPAPGTTGLAFTDFNHVNFNSLGQLAFDAALNSGEPGNDHGIWHGPPDNLTLLVREGDPAPGTAGETFNYLTYGPSMNDSGEVVFQAQLTETGADGVWRAGTNGSLELILREGEVLKVNDGDYRTVETVVVGDGLPSSFSAYNRFNEAGQLVIPVVFADGTEGVYLASPVDPATNQPPVANAGPDQTVEESQTLTLDGAGSSDPEGSIRSFVWSFNGVEVATGPQATVGPFADGIHTVTLTVTDRAGASASDDMILTIDPDLPPVANAGPDQTVNHAQTVTLSGTGSFDPEGGALTYAWTLDGMQIASVATPTVGPFAVGEHVITLTVTDNLGNGASDSMVLTVINEAPVAYAGPDGTILTLRTATLNGSGSSDPEGAPLNYAWSLGGVQIATGAFPVVGPFEAGLYTITLTVTDNHGASASDDMVLTVLNRAPTASAGADQTANYVQTVTLDGTGSADPEGSVLGYAWALDGVQIATGATPTVGPFAVGTHTVTLTVTDDHGATAADSMVVTVTNELPVADAGPDQNVNFTKGRTTTVTLDGSGSTDPEGRPVSYAWAEGGQSVGTGAILQLNLTDGVYTFTLTVTDELGATASDSVVVTVTKGNKTASL